MNNGEHGSIDHKADAADNAEAQRPQVRAVQVERHVVGRFITVEKRAFRPGHDRPS